jgi:hypothetical protein
MDCISINADGSNHDVRLQRRPSPVYLKMKHVIPKIMSEVARQKMKYLFWSGNDHKIRETVFRFKEGRLDAVAHMKRFLGSPSHWKFEYRFIGNYATLTLQEYTSVRMALDIQYTTDMGFEFVRNWEKKAVTFISRNLEKLKGRYIEYSRTMNPLGGGKNPYEIDYNRICAKYERRLYRSSIRIND